MIALEILFVTVLIAINGVLAMSEMAVVSARKVRLQRMAGTGNRGAKAAIVLIDEPTAFLSTVQIGITLVGITAGAFSGAALGAKLGEWFAQFDILAQHSATIGTAVAVLGITYLSLVVGELAPKRFALGHAETIAAQVARPMQVLATAAAPAVWLLRRSTDGLLRLLGMTPKKRAPISDDELKALIAEGTAAGQFEPQERDMIAGVLRLADRKVKAIMTPRPDVVWIDRNASPEVVATTFERHAHTRVLVCDGSVDRPLGVLQAKRALPSALKNHGIDLAALTDPVPFVNENLPALEVLEQMKRARIHIAVVRDAAGAMDGLVTMTDILESIAGDLPERDEPEIQRIVARNDGTWLVDGAMPLDTFEDTIGVHDLSETGEFVTVAGLVLERFGRVPEVGEVVVHRALRFEVVDLDGRRIDKVLVGKIDPPDSERD